MVNTALQFCYIYNMKILFILSVLVFSIYNAASQTYPSNCIATGSMENNYRNDVYKLAIKRVNDINSPWKDSVVIPSLYRDSIAIALYAMQNMQASAIKDTIQALFGIFNSNSYYAADSLHIASAGEPYTYTYKIKTLRIVVFNTASWAGDWSSDNYNNTSSLEINNLINRFNLQVSAASAQIYPDKRIYNIISPVALNIQALRNQFLFIAGTANCDLIPYFDGNSMDVDIVNADVLLTYMIRCGDCPSGCTYGRIWKFRINTGSDCSVTYLSDQYWGLAVFSPELRGDCIDAVVPVILTSIKAFKKENYQVIQWEMEKEDEVFRYEIERSANGNNFSYIGQVNIVNPSSVAKTYSWIDRALISGNIFYRIKIIDRSGFVKYSPIVTLNIKSEKTISVNPSFIQDGILNIYINKAEQGNYQYELLDITGGKIFSGTIIVNSISIREKIIIPAHIPGGLYILSLKGKSTLPVCRVYISN